MMPIQSFLAPRARTNAGMTVEGLRNALASCQRAPLQIPRKKVRLTSGLWWLARIATVTAWDRSARADRHPPNKKGPPERRRGLAMHGVGFGL